MNRLLWIAAFALTAGAAGSAFGKPGGDKPDARTPAAVLAVDDAWGNAEIDGDAAFVARLLLPGYRSIGADGKTTSRDAIIDSARQHAGSPEYKAKVAAWRAQHPSHGEVALFDDTAILTWISDAPESRGKIQSCDIFAYRAGHWRAVYSQHVGT